MSPAAVVLVLLSAAFHVGWNLLAKSSMNPKAFSLFLGTLIIGATLLLLPFLSISRIPAMVWACIVTSGAIHSVYILALSTAYETGDISFVYPITRSAPAFVPIAAYLFLGENLSARGIVGIGIVVVCIFLIQLRGDTGSELQRLWFSLKQRDTVWAFLTLGAVVAYSLVDKTGMVAFRETPGIAPGMHGPIYFLLENTICFAIFWIYMRTRHLNDIAPVWKKEWRRATIAMLGMMASYSLILHVMQTETISYIVTLRQSSVVLSVLVGLIFLKEKHGAFRMLLAGIMMAGFYLVATA